MMRFKKITALFLTFVLTFTLLLPAVTGAAEDDGNPSRVVAELPFAVLSDIHYYPLSYTGDFCDAWKEFCATDSKEYEESEALVYAALDSIAKMSSEKGYKYLLIPGDLTKDSEYQAHAELAAILEKFEQDTGIEVFVINGNHDLNVYDACTFENGVMESAPATSPDQFREIYKNLGYDHAVSTFTSSDGSYNCGLSYAADLDDSYRLIAVDSCKYSPDEAAKQQTGGMITEEAMEWIVSVAEDGIKDGKTPILMMHHSVAPHMKLEPSVTFAFCVDNYTWVAESCADAGIHYAFTGHQHTNDISSLVSDNGNAIYDCEAGALTGYPNQIRDCRIETYDNGESAMSFSLFDVDYAHAVTVNGKEYDVPFSTASFAINFGGRYSEDGYANMKEFFMGIIKNYLLPYVDDIREAGSLNSFLLSMNIDLKKIIGDFLAPYINDGISVLGINIFSADNLMWFIEDLFSQIQALYIDNPDNLISLLDQVVTDIVELKVSDIPCTKFIDTYHFGDTSKVGTFGDFVLSVMYYWYNGNEDSTNDAFVNDVIKNFSNGKNVNLLLNTLIDIVLNDLVDEAILSKLNINLGSLFGNQTETNKQLGCTVNDFVNKLLKGDTSYMNLVNVILSFGILPYESLQDVIDSLMEEYITPSQIESLGHTFEYCLNDFVTDTNPKHLGDNNVVYTTEKVKPEVTTDNFRLPTMINVTLGNDSTSANISWFSKLTVNADDIEIYKADEFNGFFGKATKLDELDYSVTINHEETTVSYPGIDLGIFGFFYYDFDVNHYTATISGLSENSTYYYRLGCEEKGWWSETGSIRTQDGSDKVTFVNVTDSQSQTKEQYERAWSKVMETAFKDNDVDFILHTGDNVDNPKNVYQWQWLFDSASSQIMNTYYMTATGNHEDSQENAIVKKFNLTNLPEQDTTTGAYYSFDYNNVHVMVLNTNDLNEDGSLSDKQTAWLIKDAAESDAQWKIVALHKAIYSNGSHYDDDDVCALRDQLSVLMPQLDIDLVFQGHDHVYMRTYALDSNAVTDTERVYLNYNGKKYTTDVLPQGTSYVITGTAGVKAYITKDTTLTDELFPRAEAIVDVEASVYSKITVDGGILYYDAYSVDGSKIKNIDSFAIQKDIESGDFAGDCEDVSAAEKNSASISIEQLFEKIVSFIKKIIKFITAFKNLFL